MTKQVLFKPGGVNRRPHHPAAAAEHRVRFRRERPAEQQGNLLRSCRQLDQAFAAARRCAVATSSTRPSASSTTP